MIACLACTAIVGLVVLAALFGILFDKGSRPEPLFLFAFAYLGVLFGICWMIMRQVSKLIDADLRSRDLSQRTSSPLVQFPPRSTNQLEEFREPASVTDHTTRTLEPNPINKL